MTITALTVITPADTHPITLAEAKGQLRITHSAEDAHIQSLIAAATAWAEDFTGRILIDTQVVHAFDCFPSSNNEIELPGGIVSAVNDIDYTDEDGAPQTLTGPTSGTPGTDYQEDLTDDERAVVFPAIEDSWPATQSGLGNAVEIDYQVGWADETEVPENIKHAIKFKTADLYSIRDSVDASKSSATRAAEDLLFPYVIQDA